MYKPPATLAPLHHRGEQHIKVLIPNEENAKALIRQVPGRKWSKTHACWYVPYTAEVYRTLKEFFEITTLAGHSENKPADTQNLVASHDAHHAAMKPPTVGERDKIPGMVGTQISPDKKITGNAGSPLPATPTATAPAETGDHELLSPPALRLERENENRLKAFVPPQQKAWIDKIKSIPGRAWNQEGRYWSLPLTRTVVCNLREWFGEQAHFPAGLPANIPENYHPKNWRQPQPENTAPPSSPAQDFSPELNKILPDWMLKQAASPPASSVATAETPGRNTDPATKEVVTAIRSQTSKHLVFLKVPAHRRDWIDFVKALPGARWIPDEKVWSLSRTQENYDRCRAFFKEKLVVDKGNPQDKMAETASRREPSPYSPTDNTRENSVPSPYPKQDAASHQPPTQGQAAFPYPCEKRRLYPPADSVKPLFFSVQKDGKAIKAVGGKLVIIEPWDEHWCCAYIPGDRQDWVTLIKNVPGRRWNMDEKAWLLPMTKETARDLAEMFGDALRSCVSFTRQLPERFIDRALKTYKHREPGYTLNEIQRLAVTALEEKLMLEGKAHRTVKTYKNQLAGLFAYYPDAKPSSLSIKQIQGYMLYKRRESKLSNSAMNSLISALNAFYGRLLNQLDKVQALERLPRQRTLPNVLSTREIQELLKAPDNLKHKCMLVLIYSAGLRKGELLRLRVRDLNPSRQSLFVKNGKGGKDRYTFYPPLAIRYVNAYLQEYKPKYWLFEGLTGDQYSESSLQEIFEDARLKSGVNPHITIHGLRHSFATHLVERGVPLHIVKQLLGHENIKTTEVYLHISNKYMSEIKSPIEGLDI